MVTSMNTVPVLRMRGGCMSVPRPCMHMYMYMYMYTHVCCASCVRVRFPLLTAIDRHTPMDRYLTSVYTHPALYADRRTRVPLRRTCATYAPRRACGRALVCVRGRARIRADACEHFPPPPSVALIGSQAFYEASAFNANIGKWNTARVTTMSDVCAAPARRAPRRTALGRSSTHARPLHAAAPPMSPRARVRMRM